MDTKILDFISTSKDFSDSLADDLEKVEKVLAEELSESENFMKENINYLVKAGGKRFRPMFVIILSRIFEKKETPGNIIKAAAMLEMIHLATLYHDDVMDEAVLRRGVEATQLKWNNSLAILGGDYLFARSSLMASSLNIDVVRMLSATYALLVTGQFRETVGVSNNENPKDYYLKVVFEKTGSLIASCGEITMNLLGKEAKFSTLAYDLGKKLGIAFQIADDILDLKSESKISGKTPGTDLKEGVLTLPIIFSLQENNEDSKQIKNILSLENPSMEDLNLLRNLVLKSDGIKETEKILNQYEQECIAIIDQFPSNEASNTLKKLVKFTINRAR